MLRKENTSRKVLTIAVPAFNSEWCIEKCLSSFIDEKIMEYLEIIVINDGSKDSTEKIALSFVKKYPNSFKVISKENGGHGSAINVAIDIATGKYFKVVDSDDWIITENLAAFVEGLNNSLVDIVLTNFHTVDIETGNRQENRTKGVALNKVMSVDEFAEGAPEAFCCVNFHGITYCTDFYRSCNIELPEKVYYEDQEYATSPFAKAKLVLPLDIFLYQYLIGNSEQSVSDKNQVKHIKDIEQIAYNVMDYYNQNPDMEEGSRKLYIYNFCAIIKSYYVVAMIKKKNRKDGRSDVSHLRHVLKAKNAKMTAFTNKDYYIVLMLHYLHVTSGMLQRMKQSGFLKKVYAIKSWKQPKT